MLHPRLETPNEGVARHRRRAHALPISTDRHGGGCKAGPVAGAMHPAYARSVPRRNAAHDRPTRAGVELPRSLDGRCKHTADRAKGRRRRRRRPHSWPVIELSLRGTSRVTAGIRILVRTGARGSRLGRRGPSAACSGNSRPSGRGHLGACAESALVRLGRRGRGGLRRGMATASSPWRRSLTTWMICAILRHPVGQQKASPRSARVLSSRRTDVPEHA